MWWSSPFVPPVFVERIRLRRAAVRYIDHGWAVTPGACPDGNRFVCGRPGCPIMGPHPALESWQDDASTDAAQVNAWWRHRPHTVLLATGGAVDVLEVPGALGLRVLGAARLHAGILGTDEARGPVAVTPTGRWMFLVRPGVALREELDNRLDVVRHGHGSWVPAVPSRMPEGRVRWAVPPEKTRWHLPSAEAVQDMLVDALGHRPQSLAVPRQVSTTRRAA